MPDREGFEGSTYHADKIDDRVNDTKQAVGGISGRSEQVPMSIDFSIFATKPMSRPTINR
ncbi:hypothetical protein SLEP1_g50629 [Rubroshorea leprosula]|uniref:Uncharacterized protein n=1 Tax=Rubroshorea leprosula TaxID=152421 RepID=A0AAV5M0N5_9ROSI|nr:hypothetical protein SLEP1_g50629 [Rubroshorea leprosula]